MLARRREGSGMSGTGGGVGRLEHDGVLEAGGRHTLEACSDTGPTMAEKPDDRLSTRISSHYRSCRLPDIVALIALSIALPKPAGANARRSRPASCAQPGQPAPSRPRPCLRRPSARRPPCAAATLAPPWKRPSCRARDASPRFQTDYGTPSRRRDPAGPPPQPRGPAGPGPTCPEPADTPPKTRRARDPPWSETSGRSVRRIPDVNPARPEPAARRQFPMFIIPKCLL